MNPVLVSRKFEEKKVSRVKLALTDMDGVLRGKYISVEKFWSALDGGLGFCDVVFGWDAADALYDNVKFTGWHTGYPDTPCQIDLASFRLIPWEPGSAFFLLDVVNRDGTPLAISPRQVFRRALSMAEERGYAAFFSAEYEFFFFRETPHSLREKGFRSLTPLSPGMFGYSVLRAGQSLDFVTQVLDSLNAFQVPLEGLHTETGPGVYEAAIAVAEGVASADRAVLFKATLKELASRHGLIPTFMAKWNPDLPGSSGHLHQSLWNDPRGHNLFYQEGDPGYSPLMSHYLAGLVAALPELMALMCPTINSYKRTVPGAWAPVNATWGLDNRTTAVRAIPAGAKSTRVETRLCGADANPYLAMAASLAAGLEGIERQLEPPEPTLNAYAGASAPPLPRNLAEATRLFRQSALARKWFGDDFVDHFAATRDWEVRQFERAVTDWELARYFEAV
jgi:glutamine synthetase